MNSLVSSTREALLMVIAMGFVILFCRFLPFLFSSKAGKLPSPAGKGPSPAGDKFLNFVEKTVPPAAMTVLAFNALGLSFKLPTEGFIALISALITALLHLWKRNAFLSIAAGTLLYMLLLRLI